MSSPRAAGSERRTVRWVVSICTLWTAIIGELGGTNDAAANVARIWTAPACAASYNGC